MASSPAFQDPLSDGAPASVLLLEDDENLRGMLGEFIAAVCHSQCIGVPSVEAMVALGERALSCDCAILDINLGPDRPSGIDAFLWLVQQNFRGRIAFLTGHARSHPLVNRAIRLGDASVFQKPISAEQIQELVAPRER